MKTITYWLLLLVVTTTYSQHKIQGTLKDKTSKEPLIFANVYFPELEKGTTSDDNGMFSISNLPTGTYKIIISTIGYETLSKEITIPSEIDLNLELSPSAVEIEEIIISTPFHKLQSENVVKVDRASIVELKAKGAISLADGITNIAGVESFTTGVGIGKPVIRGLSSNRVLVYTQGIRLENQQFGDEHGLGVNDAGISSVEVIKGPASLLYGSDALGGVLYLNPERFANAGNTEGDVSLNYFSNTQGSTANAGIKTSGERFKYILRGAHTSHADYKTGDQGRVTNSRFNEYDIKAALGYQITKFKTELRYNFNRSDLGIPEEIAEQSTNRSPLLPSQEINSHIFSSKSNIFFNNSSLDVTFGYIFNDRKEFEEEEGIPPGEPALDLDLKTFSYNVLYNLPKFGAFETIVGVQGIYQTNENFGEEILIPDAIVRDIGFLATTHYHLNNSDFQFGLRFDNRSIDTERTELPDDGGFLNAVDRNFSSFNASLGYKVDLSETIIGRVNFATGFRAPNLSELTSNGIHVGTNRFEIGDPNLDNEQNFQTDVSLEFNNQHFEFYVNGFYNKVNDFIFVQPTGNFIDGNEVFLFEQEDSELYGGEIGFHLHPHPIDWLHLESSFQTVIGKQGNGDDLPLIPANSLTNTFRVEFNKIKSFENNYAFITLQNVFNQNRVSPIETRTGGYSLFNLGAGTSVSLFKNKADIRVSINNLFDKSYIAHLSRLKVDNIPNIGRNISIGINYTL